MSRSNSDTDMDVDMDMDMGEPVSSTAPAADERTSTTPTQPAEHTYTAEEIDAAHTLLDLSREARVFNRESETATSPTNRHGHSPAPGVQRDMPAPVPVQRRPVALNQSGRPVIRHPGRFGRPAQDSAAARTPGTPTLVRRPPPALAAAAAAHAAPGRSAAEAGLGMRREPMTAEQALQAYLLRQQFIAGIPFERMTPMNRRRLQGAGGPRAPGLIRVTNDGVLVPDIPPARFDGVFHPLPTLPPGFGHDGPAEDVADRAPEIQDHQSESGAENVVHELPGAVDGAGARFVHSQDRMRDERIRVDRYDNDRRRQRKASEDRSRKRRRIEKSRSSSIETESDFNIFEALVRRPELCLKILKYLDPTSLENLYATSRDIESFINSDYENTIKEMASRIAPESAEIYPARCYPRVCISPPPVYRAPRLYPYPVLPAKVPSIKWLHMIEYRDSIVHDILVEMENAGVELPERCSVVIKKLWFLMDIPDNQRRVWTIKKTNIWPDADIFLAVLFFVKLETALHPSFGLKSNRVRRLLLAQPSLKMMHGLLCKKDALQTPFDLFQAYVRWKYAPLPHEIDREVFGIPAAQVGRLQYEKYGRGRNCTDKFLAPDELVLRECQERELNLGELHVDFFWYDRMPAKGLPSGGYRERDWEEEIVEDGLWKACCFTPLKVALDE